MDILNTVRAKLLDKLKPKHLEVSDLSGILLQPPDQTIQYSRVRSSKKLEKKKNESHNTYRATAHICDGSCLCRRMWDLPWY